jgi:hypothetical protein
MKVTVVRSLRLNRGVGEREQHEIPVTRYVIDGDAVGRELSLKQLYFEAARRGEKVEFVKE